MYGLKGDLSVFGSNHLRRDFLNSVFWRFSQKVMSKALKMESLPRTTYGILLYSVGTRKSTFPDQQTVFPLSRSAFNVNFLDLKQPPAPSDWTSSPVAGLSSISASSSGRKDTVAPESTRAKLLMFEPVISDNLTSTAGSLMTLP